MLAIFIRLENENDIQIRQHYPCQHAENPGAGALIPLVYEVRTAPRCWPTPHDSARSESSCSSLRVRADRCIAARVFPAQELFARGGADAIASGRSEAANHGAR